ncbi:MAG: hypothetical protein IT186_22815 [Acidobacteria bacterium]|nr:hypothetical protein [Acidobacteriota bacterium]MCG3192664.1 hypothetical protein [Thermoanaerobaculia bacterium]MCK6685861.1 hypothetical protein [Thermoanaerobaculia bacterium]
MDIPMKVLVTCPLAKFEQVQGTLIAVSASGFYEMHIPFGVNTHTVLLPVAATVLTAREPLLAPPAGFEVER